MGSFLKAPCEFVHAGNCEHIKGEKNPTGRTVKQNELDQTLIEDQQKVGVGWGADMSFELADGESL